MSSAFTEPVVSPARLGRIYAFYAIGFAFFVLVLGLLEDQGITRQAIGYLFLGSTLLIAGVTSYGKNGNCAGTGGVFRLDRQNVLDFINKFKNSPYSDPPFQP